MADNNDVGEYQRALSGGNALANVFWDPSIG